MAADQVALGELHPAQYGWRASRTGGRRRRSALAALLLVALLPGCRHLGAQGPPAGGVTGDRAAARTGAGGGGSTVEERGEEITIRGDLPGLGGTYDEAVAGRFVINSRADWETMWRHQGSPARPIPDGFDPARETALAVFLGVRNTGGFAVRILRVARVGEEVVVTAEETVPGRDCMVTTAITYPRHGVVVDRVTQPVRFQVIRRTVDCE